MTNSPPWRSTSKCTSKCKSRRRLRRQLHLVVRTASQKMKRLGPTLIRTTACCSYRTGSETHMSTAQGAFRQTRRATCMSRASQPTCCLTWQRWIQLPSHLGSTALAAMTIRCGWSRHLSFRSSMTMPLQLARQIVSSGRGWLPASRSCRKMQRQLRRPPRPQCYRTSSTIIMCA